MKQIDCNHRADFDSAGWEHPDEGSTNYSLRAPAAISNLSVSINFGESEGSRARKRALLVHFVNVNRERRGLEQWSALRFKNVLFIDRLVFILSCIWAQKPPHGCVKLPIRCERRKKNTSRLDRIFFSPDLYLLSTWGKSIPHHSHEWVVQCTVHTMEKGGEGRVDFIDLEHTLLSLFFLE